MKRVLLAEDNKINQVVAAGTLKKLGYEVDIVETGADAVAAATDFLYAAVLMDVMMPVMDGYQATREIRGHEARAGRPPMAIIGLSARAMAGDREIALGSGMNEYLTKPLRTDALAAALESWITEPVTIG